MAEEAREAAVIDIDRVVSSVMQNIEALDGKAMAAEMFTIFRVPAHVRRRNRQLYEPQMVSVGPYSRGNPALKAMEQHKWRYLRDFLCRNSYNAVDDYVNEIRPLEPQARRCYFEAVELASDEFVEMLLLDGCFIIEFLIKWNYGNKDGVCDVGWSLPVLRGDMLMLENQIPFFVLVSLFGLLVAHFNLSIPNHASSEAGEIPSLTELAVRYLTQGAMERPPASTPPGEEIHHLLHLYHCCFVPHPNGSTPPNSSLINWLNPSRVIASLLSRVVGSDKDGSPVSPDEERLPRTIPCATELQEAGVTFEKKKNPISFLDITFRDGILEIPFLSVEDSTQSRFMNLVAFEQCAGRSGQNYMTSYACFMDCVVDTPRDVAALHESGILENMLASDAELALFFSHLCHCAAMDYEKHYLAGLFREVGKYCNSDWHRWRAKLKRDYFSNPWAIISLAAASVLLILTFLQTFFTIFPYYHPR